VLILLGLFIGTLFSQTTQLILALSGLVLGFVIAFMLDKLVIRKKKGVAPVMTEIVSYNAPTLTPQELSELASDANEDDMSSASDEIEDKTLQAADDSSDAE
jgi:hypothetical protein